MTRRGPGAFWLLSLLFAASLYAAVDEEEGRTAGAKGAPEGSSATATGPSSKPAEPSPTPAAPSPTEYSPAPAEPPPRPRAERAAELLLRGKAEEAAALYAEALAANPEEAVSLEGRVRALIAIGRWRQALEEARRFAAAHPGAGIAQSALGEALYRAGALGEARATLEPLAASPSPPPRALMTLGLVRVAEGREDEGAKLMDRALSLAPEDRDVVLSAAGAAPSRARAGELLERYLMLSPGDDPDRIEGARGTLRLYAALGERRVWVPASRPRSLELPLRPLIDRGGKTTGFIAELSPGQGKPVRVLLDTGSSGLFMLERIALGAGFASLAEETTFGGGGEGRQPSRRGLIPAVGLGELRFEDALASTTTQEIEPTGRYHGVLGLSVFDGYLVRLDLARGRLSLESPPETAEGSPYWTVSGQMLVEAATSSGQAGLFLFDTGAARSLLSLALLESGSAQASGEPATVRTYGGPMSGARTVRGVRLRFQGLENQEAVLNAADLAQRSRLGGVEISGFLGLDLLNRARITIDTKHRRLSVTKAGRR